MSTSFQNKKLTANIPNLARINTEPDNIASPVNNARRISLTGDFNGKPKENIVHLSTLCKGLSPIKEQQENVMDWKKPSHPENVWQIWKILLIEHEKIARAHLAACQVQTYMIPL